MGISPILMAALPFMIAAMVVEAVLTARAGHPAYQGRDFCASMSQLVGNSLVNFAVGGVVVGFYIYLHQFALFEIGSSIWELALLLVLIDFLFYWFHRASHRVRLLWGIHVSHHSSELMNFGTALRQPWLTPLPRVLFYWPVPVIGFDPLLVGTVGAIATIYGFWTHTETIRWRGGWLGYIFVFPTHHRVHHGANPIYIDKNYANFLIIWDRLFGTYQDEVEPVKYGITAPINTYNPLKIAFGEWFGMISDMIKARRLMDALRYMWMPPGWQPKVMEKQDG
ncbi:MAG: sterol desaturase family protein [Alphaproteobacteria bacterium]